MPCLSWKTRVKNSGRVLHALDLFEELQNTVAEDPENMVKLFQKLKNNWRTSI